ncbi:unnamed protein product, partial [marine sediment metagenome]
NHTRNGIMVNTEQLDIYFRGDISQYYVTRIIIY